MQTLLRVLLLLLIVGIGSVVGGPKFVVLTYNRLASLKRLLVSLEAVEPRGEQIDLRICVDKPESKKDEVGVQTTLNFATEYKWPRGRKEVFQHPTNVGIVGQWLNCWQPRGNTESAIILEDDLELSVVAYQWIVYEQNRYKSSSDVAGFSLQRQTNCFHSACKSGELRIPVGILEYRYKLVGTWGFSPHTKRWLEFQEWYRKMSADPKYAPSVDRLLPTQWYRNDLAMGKTKSLWSIWYLDYCEKNNLYTVYYNDPANRTLAGNWKEPGVHFGSVAKTTDFPLLKQDFGRESAPISSIVTLEWNGMPKPPPSFDSMITKTLETISRRAEIPLISFVNLAFFNMVMHFLCNLKQAAPDLVENIIFVATDRAMFERLQKLSFVWRFSVLELLAVSTEREMRYGTKQYNMMILDRTIAVQKIMDIGFPFMLIECDAAVRTRFVDAFIDEGIRTDADAIGIAEHPDMPQKWPNGGFILFTGKRIVSDTWKLVTARFKANLDKFAKSKPGDAISIEHEQTIFGNMLTAKDSKFKLALLDRNRFMSGKTLKVASMAKKVESAEVMLLNFVIGLQEKVALAKKHKIWYLNEATGECANDASHAIVAGANADACTVEQFSSSPQWPVCSNLLPRSRAPRVWSFGVGDNINFELAFLKKFPDADVCSFDPTVSFLRFAALCDDEDRCPSFRKLGLGPKTGVVEFYKSDKALNKHLTVRKQPGYSLATKAEVKTLPDMMQFLGVAHVDVLKLNVEGAEVSIFTGLKELSITQITLQMHDGADPKQTDRARVVRELASLGYEQRFLAGSKMEILFTKGKSVSE